MKEELKNYLKDKAFDEMWYGCSTESWMDILDSFFDQYQPERSKREDPHMTLEEVQNMNKEEMIEHMKQLEDVILRQYIQMASCYGCPKCVGCGALNSMET